MYQYSVKNNINSVILSEILSVNYKEIVRMNINVYGGRTSGFVLLDNRTSKDKSSLVRQNRKTTQI